jgi:chemotaxis protein methyltransferase CheR
LIDRKTAQAGTGKIPIRIWSAACSTGQEVYSIAMTLKEMLPDISKYNIKIIGTDISSAAVTAASNGKYNKFEIERGLASDKLKKHFELEGDAWKKFNLFEEFSTLGKFDIIFCRNVAIYFSIEDRKIIFNKIADILEPSGSLLIGSSEFLAGISDRFQSQRHVKSVYYQLKEHAEMLSKTIGTGQSAAKPAVPVSVQ